MRTKQLVAALALTAALGGASYGVYRLGMQQGMQMSSAASTPAASAEAGGQAAGDAAGGKTDPKTGKRVLYWHDPMVPGQKFDKPGKSPFMDMELVPVYAEDASDDGTVAVSPRLQQSLGVRTAEVTTGQLARSVEAVGSVAYNERDVALVQARSNGFVERLHEGTWVGHVAEHVALQLQQAVGHDLRKGQRRDPARLDATAAGDLPGHGPHPADGDGERPAPACRRAGAAGAQGGDPRSSRPRSPRRSTPYRSRPGVPRRGPARGRPRSRPSRRAP